jgi:hypothetical protein
MDCRGSGKYSANSFRIRTVRGSAQYAKFRDRCMSVFPLVGEVVVQIGHGGRKLVTSSHTISTQRTKLFNLIRVWWYLSEIYRYQNAAPLMQWYLTL